MSGSLSVALAQLVADADRVIETSCATVILKGAYAYKVKKAVDYGFLDFTTPKKRTVAIERELAFNKRLAADIYIRTEEVAGESVLVMRRFDTRQVLAELAVANQMPDMAFMRNLGQAIAKFHAGASVCQDAHHADNSAYVISTSRDNIALFRDDLGCELVDAYDSAIAATHSALSQDMHARFEAGFVRHGHGDLHLGNILSENSQAILFDCIEFNDRLSQIDVLYDLAFLLMDLSQRGHIASANAVMNAWLEQAVRIEAQPTEVYRSLKLLPFYLSLRAGVRCHVSAHQGDLAAARSYLATALDVLAPTTPGLQAIGGLSASGKSTKARSLAPLVQPIPGAVILRSDEIRKQLWACPELEQLPPEAYSPAENERVYREMFVAAKAILRAGRSVILDATFRDEGYRAHALSLANDLGLPFSGLWLEVPVDVRAQRAAGRAGDVSDADCDIVLSQEPIDPKATGWHVESRA